MILGIEHSADNYCQENNNFQDGTDIGDPLAHIERHDIDPDCEPGQHHANGDLPTQRKIGCEHLFEYPGKQNKDSGHPHRGINPISPGGSGCPAPTKGIPNPGVDSSLLRIGATHLSADHGKGYKEDKTEKDPPEDAGCAHRSCCSQGIQQQYSRYREQHHVALFQGFYVRYRLMHKSLPHPRSSGLRPRPESILRPVAAIGRCYKRPCQPTL